MRKWIRHCAVEKVEDRPGVNKTGTMDPHSFLFQRPLELSGLSVDFILRTLGGQGIVNPAEFFFGIGICIGVPQLAISIAFGCLLYWKERLPLALPDKPSGWRYDWAGILGCLLCTAGLIAIFVVPLFSPPNEVPRIVLSIMAIGMCVASLGLLVQLGAIAFDFKALLRQQGEDEITWARLLVSVLPYVVLISTLLRLYLIFDVR